MSFQILDKKRYPLKVREEKLILPYYRWEHRATIGWNTREFLVFADHVKGECFIEEVVGGHLEDIKDDSLHSALTNFCYEHSFLEVSVPPPRKILP